jgi:DNA-binding LytR/AlgR family response regulator
MNVLIVEDEVPAAEHIITLLKKTGEPIVVQGILGSIERAVNFFSSGQKPDLLIMDIELADGKCFEIFQQVKVEIPIIFMSTNDQYARQAFDYFSIDYLLKPIQQEDLENALKKWRRISTYQARVINDQSNQSKDGLAKEKPKARLLIKSGNKLQYKSTEDVAYILADGKEVYIYTKIENKKYLIDYTLEELESLLDKHKFFRISRKVIVNADVIAEVKGLISTRLEVKLNQPCEHELTISRDRSAVFKAWLDQ